MATISVNIEGTEKLGRNLSILEQRVFPDAATRAVNNVAKTLRARSGSSIAAAMGAKVGAVKRRITVTKAKRGKTPVATLTLSGRALNLIEFRARQTKKGVSAAPWANRRIFRTGFIVEIGGNKLVMIRRKRGGRRVPRLPIRSMLGPGVAKEASTPELAAERSAIVRERMSIELESQLDYLVSRAVRR